MTPVGAGLLAAAAVVVAVPGGRGARRLQVEPVPVPTRWGLSPARWVLMAAGSALLLAVSFGLGGRLVLAGLGVVGLAALGRRAIRQASERRARRQRHLMVIEVCDALAAELHGGLPANQAVARSCAGHAALLPVTAAARLGGDLAEALRSTARQPGAAGLRAVAAAWDVAGSSGAALAGVLERVAVSLRHDEDARAEVEAALGPPRATARMLAVLPIFGLGLGVSIGAHPLAFLFGSAWGLACCSLGAMLAALGVWWVDRLAAAAED